MCASFGCCKNAHFMKSLLTSELCAVLCSKVVKKITFSSHLSLCEVSFVCYCKLGTKKIWIKAKFEKMDNNFVSNLNCKSSCTCDLFGIYNIVYCWYHQLYSVKWQIALKSWFLKDGENAVYRWERTKLE